MRKEKQKASGSSEPLKRKLARRNNSSFSSPSTKKGKPNLSCLRDNSNDLPKEKLVRKVSSLSSSTKRSEQRSISASFEKLEKRNALMKARIKELGPICKRRKEMSNSIQVDEDIDVYLDREIEQQGKTNPEDCLWLSSGSMSPQDFGLFMSALDPCLDELVLSFLPRSSKTPKGSVLSKGVEVEEAENEVNRPSIVRSQSIDSSGSSSLALTTYTDSSSFWNMDRTGVWVSLINLNGEDSKFISDVDSHLDELESNFPSPNHEINWDSYSSDVGVSSSAKSTQETASQSEWSSDLLSDSMDWELDSDDPIFWPYGVDVDWDNQGLDSFSVSPRKGVYKIRFESGKDGVVPDSIRFRLHGRNGKQIVFMSGLSASKMIEFKKGCRKNGGGLKRYSKIGKRANRFKKRVPPILENDLEGISPKDTPKESLRGNRSSHIDLSECTDNWVEEIDSEGPLFWPNDQKQDWDLTLDDSFNISPRKISQNSFQSNQISSPKSGFPVSSSVRLKFRPKKMKSKVFNDTKTGLAKLKSFKKTNSVLFKHGSHGKKKRDLPVGKSVEEFIRLISIIGMNKMFPEGHELSSELEPIETLVGLNEFDGHEGVDMEFEGENFSLDECIRGCQH
ncbi:unnamed protein product [Amaranthus hypochondriacus]